MEQAGCLLDLFLRRAGGDFVQKASAHLPELVKAVMLGEVLLTPEYMAADPNQTLHYQFKVLAVEEDDRVAEFVGSSTGRLDVGNQKIGGFLVARGVVVPRLPTGR